jgi:hypothetical protein
LVFNLNTIYLKIQFLESRLTCLQKLLTQICPQII